MNPTLAKNLRHAYRGCLKTQKEKSQQRMSKDDRYSHKQKIEKVSYSQ